MPTRFPHGPLFQTPTDLGLTESSGENVVHLSNARVAIADYDLIQHDFPHLGIEHLLRRNPRLARLDLAARGDAIRSTIDEWLITNAAVISTVQARQELVNTPIPVDSVVRRGYRPKGYGRAIVVPVRETPHLDADNGSTPSPAGVLDLKGVGVAADKTPSLRPASDGLFALECAFREYLMQRVIDLIFERELPSFWTVPTYAVLSLGFGLLGPWREAPAGMHVRRAHRRPRFDERNPSRHKVQLEIELLLRRYGLTSTNPAVWIEIQEANGQIVVTGRDPLTHPLTPADIGLCLALKGQSRYMKIECSGVQLAGDVSWPPPTGLMVDFGTISARRSFDCPLALDERISLNLSRPNTPGFVQPDPHKALAIETWESRRIKASCRRLARQFILNEISPAELRERLEAPLRSLAYSYS